MKTGVGVSHGSQECCGNGLEGQKRSMRRVLGVSHGSQEWGASKGVRVFLMVPKSGVGKAWEGKK